MKNYIKPKLYDRHVSLKGSWLFTYKIDGIRAFTDGQGNFWSRANKPLYNLDKFKCRRDLVDFEIYSGSWEETMTAVRSSKVFVDIPEDHIYSLFPVIDKRLVIGPIYDPTPTHVDIFLEDAIKKGYEGLILRGPKNKWLKVKPFETFDVPIEDIIEGTGKYLGKMGAIVTPMGKVGTGFDDVERNWFWRNRKELIGKMIEVKCSELTKNGKFRNPSFVRVRWDKA